MSEAQRKALYTAAAAILAALGAFGIVDSAQTEQVLGIVSGALTLAMAVVPVIAHRKVGLAGVSGGVVGSSLPDETDEAVDSIDLSDPDALADTEPRHAEPPSVIPDSEGVATN